MTAPDVSPRAADTHDGVARVASNGIEIAYESFGDPADPTILLVMGLGTQMLAWPDELCEALADAGHHVVRFDNRDVGLSTHIDAPAPGLLDILRRRPAYTIGDMADDAVGLSTPSTSSGPTWWVPPWAGSSARPWPSTTRSGSRPSR